MHSFKKFLEERKVDPLELNKRVARRYGKGNFETDQYDDVVKQKHIPLNKYNYDDADDAELAYFKHAKSFGDLRVGNDSHKKFQASFKTKNMNISDLHPTQPFVRTENDALSSEKIKNGGNVRVAQHNGKHFILDGHHTVNAARMRGEKIISVQHVNLDKK